MEQKVGEDIPTPLFTFLRHVSLELHWYQSQYCDPVFILFVQTRREMTINLPKVACCLYTVGCTQVRERVEPPCWLVVWVVFEGWFYLNTVYP